MFKFFTRNIKTESLESLSQLYSPRFDKDESYLSPKTSAEKVDYFAARFEDSPELFAGSKGLISIAKYSRQLAREKDYLQALRLICAVIKTLPLEQSIDASAMPQQVRSVLNGLGKVLPDLADSESRLLKSYFEYEMRPRDGYRLQLSQFAPGYIKAVREMAKLFAEIRTTVTPDRLSLFALSIKDFEKYERSCCNTADSMQREYEKRTKSLLQVRAKLVGLLPVSDR